MTDKTPPKTGAKVPPPARNMRMELLDNLTQQPTMVVPAADNMRDEPWKDLGFKVSPEFHKRFKAASVGAGLSMKELLEESFDAWIESRKGR